MYTKSVSQISIGKSHYSSPTRLDIYLLVSSAYNIRTVVWNRFPPNAGHEVDPE